METQDSQDAYKIEIDEHGFVNPQGKSQPDYKVQKGRKVKFKLTGGVTRARVTFPPNRSPFDVDYVDLPHDPLKAENTGGYAMGLTLNGTPGAGLTGTLDVDSKPYET